MYAACAAVAKPAEWQLVTDLYRILYATIFV